MLSRAATARVLQSLIEAELKHARDRSGAGDRAAMPLAGAWPEALSLGGEGVDGLGLDSLEMMAIGAAINEMFHLHESTQDIDLAALASFGDWLDAIEAAWAHSVSRITFVTSGSTGLPKRCVHDGAALRKEAAFLATLFASRRRIVSLAPAHHIYGCLLAGFLADQLGVDVVPGAACSPRFLNSALLPGDLVVSFPERWSAIHRTVSAWADDVEGVVSTAPCPPALIASLLSRGLHGMTELYGSSETAGIGWRRHPSEVFTLMPHWNFAAGVGYDGRGMGLRREDGGIDEIPDHVETVGDRQFTVGGRRDGAVQVGGTNVWPGRIAAELARHPKVSAASVRLSQRPAGARLKAFVVPASGAPDDGLSADLETWCRMRLPPAAIPRSWTFGSRLPVNAFGKPTDWPDGGD